MLQHLRPVKVVLTPLHLRVLFRESVLALGFALALERESPSPKSVSIIAGGSLADKVVCFLCTYGASCPDNRFWLPNSPVSALRQLGYSQLAARIGDPAAGLRGHHGCPHPPGFLLPRDQVTAARVLATPRCWQLFPLAENEVGKKYFHLRKCCFARRTLIKPLEFHFGHPIPLSLRTINAPKNVPRDWSAVTRRFWLIRFLRAGSQSAATK